MLEDREEYTEALDNIPQSEHVSSVATTRDVRSVMLSGFLPVYQEKQGDTPLVMLMRPKSQKPDLPPPLFQICKGTRMCRVDGRWRDLSATDLPVENALAEPLAITALREAEEEIGLRLDNIITIASVGVVPFISSSTGSCKYMGLFVGAIKDPDAFHAPSETEASTAERRWVSPNIMKGLVKDDHAEIILPALRAVGFDEI